MLMKTIVRLLLTVLFRLLLTVLFAFIGALGGCGFVAVTGLRGDSETMLTPIVWGFWLGGVFGFLIPGMLSRGTTRPADGEAARSRGQARN